MCFCSTHYWDDVEKVYDRYTTVAIARADWHAEWEAGTSPTARVKRAYPLCLLSGWKHPHFPTCYSRCFQALPARLSCITLGMHGTYTCMIVIYTIHVYA